MTARVPREHTGQHPSACTARRPHPTATLRSAHTLRFQERSCTARQGRTCGLCSAKPSSSCSMAASARSWRGGTSSGRSACGGGPAALRAAPRGGHWAQQLHARVCSAVAGQYKRWRCGHAPGAHGARARRQQSRRPPDLWASTAPQVPTSKEGPVRCCSQHALAARHLCHNRAALRARGLRRALAARRPCTRERPYSVGLADGLRP